jgi:hypothetical protein
VFVFIAFTFDAFVFATTVEFELFALEVSEFCPHPAATPASASAHAPHKSLFITSLLSSVVWTYCSLNITQKRNRRAMRGPRARTEDAAEKRPQREDTPQTLYERSAACL